MFYLMTDKWSKKYYVKSVFIVRDLKQATELMQKQGKIGLSNEIVEVRKLSAVKYWWHNCKGDAAGALIVGDGLVMSNN